MQRSCCLGRSRFAGGRRSVGSARGDTWAAGRSGAHVGGRLPGTNRQTAGAADTHASVLRLQGYCLPGHERPTASRWGGGLRVPGARGACPRSSSQKHFLPEEGESEVCERRFFRPCLTATAVKVTTKPRGSVLCSTKGSSWEARPREARPSPPGFDLRGASRLLAGTDARGPDRLTDARGMKVGPQGTDSWGTARPEAA